MNIFRSLGSAIRRLSILLLVAALVAFFLFLYYYRYVPLNRERLQRQGFLLLKQQEQGLLQSIEDLRNAFNSSAKSDLKRNKIVLEINQSINLVSPVPNVLTRTASREDPKSNTTDTSALSHFHYAEKELGYEFRLQFPNDTTGYYYDYRVKLNQVFANILESGKNEFYSDYMVIYFPDTLVTTLQKRDKEGNLEKVFVSNLPKTIYSTSSLSLAETWMSDTTIRFSYVQFPKIEDLEIAGTKYKIFLQPFRFEGAEQMVLGGLIPLVDYNDRLQNIPFRPVSIIIIVFIMILIALPYVKTFFISSEEKFGIRDIVALGLTMILGSAILLVILQHMMMRTGASLRSKDELRYLSDSINLNFKRELWRAHDAIVYWDQQLKEHKADNDDSLKSNASNKALKQDSLPFEHKEGNYSSKFTLLLPQVDTGSYLNYTMIHWADYSSQQWDKSRILKGDAVFNKLWNRTYFTDLVNNKLFEGRNETTGQTYKFCMQPVVSMTTHAFEANISEISNIDGIKMVALSAQLYSLINTILPPGFGFYVIDLKGNIQFQSEGNVTLKENFLQWINDEHELELAMKSRQNREYNDLTFNNRRYSVFVRPLDNLPLYLIVYKSNDETTSSILHVSAFTISLVFVYFIMISAFCWIAWKKTNFYSVLYQPIFQYSWLKPDQEKMKFFRVGIGFVLCYMAGTAICVLSIPNLHSAKVYIGFFFPLFTLWILYILFRKLYVLRIAEHPQRINWKEVLGTLGYLYNIVPLLLLFGLTVVFFKFEERPLPGIFLMCYTALSFLLIWFVTYKSLNMPNPVFDWLRKKHPDWIDLQALYALFWFFCMIAISFVPAHCFFDYAQSKEIDAQIRRSQLSIAQSMETRLKSKTWIEDVIKGREPTSNQKDSVLYLHGVYALKMCDSIHVGDDTLNKSKTLEEPYDRIVRMISWNYHSLDKFVNSQSRAEDTQWIWHPNNGKAELDYHPRAENIPFKDFARNRIYLRSSIPGTLNYFRLNTFIGLTTVLLLSAALLGGFLITFRNITQRLFPLRHQPLGGAPGMEDNIFLKLYNASYGSFENMIKEVLHDNFANAEDAYGRLQSIWKQEFYRGSWREKFTAEIENEILKNQHRFKEMYDEFWDSCNDREKFVLYNFSREGFVNYRNSFLISGLLRKGLVTFDEQRGLNIMSVSFRNYILDKKNDEEITQLTEKFHKPGSWDNIRTPILIAITAVGAFLFITQEDLLQRAAALVPTLSGLFGLGSLILSSKSSSSSPR